MENEILSATNHPEHKLHDVYAKGTQDTLIKNLANTRYTNPILQNSTPQQCTQANFSRYQQNIQHILLQLLGQINFIHKTFTAKQHIPTHEIQDSIIGAEAQCKLLEEYCTFFKSNDLPLPYYYLGSIAHTLKPIAGNIQESITDQEAETSQSGYHFTKKYIEASIGNIKNNLKKINKIEYTQPSLYIKHIFSPYTTSQKIIQHYIHNTDPKNIQIENTIPQNISIQSYQEIFEITLENLITNAVKFTPPNGKITIGVYKDHESSISFFVQDTGIGIPADTDIFDENYSTPSLEGKNGTGVGLAHTKVFIEMMGEHIYHTDNPPHGTKFIFSMKKTHPQKDLQK